MTTTTRERNFKKNPHTARWLQTFHAAAYGLASDVKAETAGEDLLNLVPTAAPAYRPSPAQVKFISDLILQINAMDTELGEQAASYTAKMDREGAWTKENTSRWIDRLIAKRAELRAAAPVAPKGKPVAAPVGITEDGMYLFEEKIYKVQFAVNGSGRLYAKLLVRGADGENATFEYAHGVVTKLRPEHKMTLEQAKAFGALYGTCIRCGRTLTDEFSIANGLGKVCITKF